LLALAPLCVDADVTADDKKKVIRALMPDNPFMQAVTRNHEAAGNIVWKPPHYFSFYAETLVEMRAAAKSGRTIKMIEIGVNTGGAISMWKSYFGASLVYHGVDINPNCNVFADANAGVHIHIGSQGNASFLAGVLASMGGEVDFVIDDGSHYDRLTIASFEALYPAVRLSGGVYMIEDVSSLDAQKELITYVNALVQFAQGPRISWGSVWGGPKWAALPQQCGPPALPRFCVETRSTTQSSGLIAFRKWELGSRPEMFFGYVMWGKAQGGFGARQYLSSKTQDASRKEAGISSRKHG